MTKKDTKKEEIQDEVEETKEVASGEFEVSDPEIARPKELPLVVKPIKGGEWANEAQAEYARTLNGYAYANPEKWAIKKDILLARLSELGKTPSSIVKFRGMRGKVGYKNKLVE